MEHLSTTLVSVLDNAIINIVAGLLVSAMVFLWRAIRRSS
jgi:hypothetical protein